MTSSDAPTRPSKTRSTLTVDEVAEELQVHPNTVYGLLRSGELRALKVGSMWRVPRSRLVEYLEERS